MGALDAAVELRTSSITRSNAANSELLLRNKKTSNTNIAARAIESR